MNAVLQTQGDTLGTFESMNLSPTLVADLQSDHAGETGAVYIYRGILGVSRDAEVMAFARQHMATELEHLAFFESWLPAAHHSALLPLWRLSGWLLGALPALVGKRAVFQTIAAVETFVEDHYQSQIDALADVPAWQGLRRRLMAFCAEEVAHRDDAARRNAEPAGSIARIWGALVDAGSRAGVWVARRF